MNKKTMIAFISCSLFSTVFLTQKQIDPEIDFYNVTFLRNSPAVEKVLKAKGFFEVDLTTKDNLQINTIMLDRSKDVDVSATIISSPGFVPGRKEGMTTLYAMLEEQPYNFIFIDSRGHGKSQGELLTLNGIKQYGESQYLDVVATAQFVAKYNKELGIKPDIILHGLCAGAFHTIKAMGYLKKHDLETYNCIKGIIFDSGWPAIVDIAETVVSAEAASRCKEYSVPFLEKYASYFIVQFYRFFFKEQHSKQESINQAMSEIDQPILFIHADNDLFTPVHHVYPLIATAKKPVTWFVKDSSHVANHLKHKEKYTEQMQQFIQAAL
jgi:pimeloyl-ACP methyl ester carboxylesterase